MKTVKFTFEGSEITFTFDTENKIMVNATEMAKVFNKYPKDFLILETTKSFITEALRKENSPNSNDKNSPNSDYSDDENNAKKRFSDDEKPQNCGFWNIKSEEDLYTTNQRYGTFMHQVLALKFAAWLSPKFEIWVYCTIQKLLFGRYIEREASLKKTEELKNEIKDILSKESRTVEDFDRFLKISNDLNTEKNKRKSLTMECIKEIKDAIDIQYKIDYPDN